MLTHPERLVQHAPGMPQPWHGVDVSFVDSLMVPASLHDVDGRFIHINAAAERASGLSREHLLGRHYTEPVSPEARQSVTEQFRRAVECGEPTDFETYVAVKRGAPLSPYATHFIAMLRAEMESAGKPARTRAARR